MKAICGLAVLALVVAGCAKSGNSKAYDGSSDNCSSEFVSNYNSVVNELKWSTDHFRTAESLVNQFEAKYKDVSCAAVLLDTSKLDNSASKIEVNSKVKEWRSAIAQARTRSSAN